MNRRKLLTLAGSIGLILVLVAISLAAACAKPAPAPTPAGPIIELKTQSRGGEKFVQRVAQERWQQRIEELSGGRIKFTYYPGEGLLKAREAFGALREGVLDIAQSSPGYVVGEMTIIGETMWMPGAFTYEKFCKHYKDPGKYYDFCAPYYEKVGLKLLMHMSMPASLVASTKPIKTLEDCEGLLRRDSGAHAPWFKCLKFVPVKMASAEVYESIQRGMIDCSSSSASAVVTTRWYEIAPYIINTRMLMTGMCLLMNLNRYNSLPSDLRDVIDKSVEEMEQWYPSLVDEDYAESVATLKGTPGVEWYELPEAERQRWVEALAPFYKGFEEKYGDEWTRFWESRKALL